MTAAQIIILSVLFLILSLSTFYYFRKAQKHDCNVEDMGYFLYVVCLFFTFFILGITLIENNKLMKQMKCPEYEKVENVYKLKQ